jgi:sarcosine oxidase
VAVDVVVIGLGIMGASAASALALRGARVVALDPHPPGHDRGSSHGESRIFRLAYFEHPSYVPLARAARDAWHDLERRSGQTVLNVTGIVEAGHPESAIVQGSLAASRLHGLAHEVFSGRDLGARYPQFHLPADWLAVYQPDGGFLHSERALRLYCALAMKAGTDLRIGVRARGIRPRSGFVEVDTDHGIVEAGTIVVAAGGWIGDLVPELRGPLTLTRQVLGWFRPKSPQDFSPDRFPVFILETESDWVYGFPDFAGAGVKVASHRPGNRLAHADAACQDASPADAAVLEAVLRRHLPQAAGTPDRLRTCFYTRTPDEDFVVASHPDDSRIVIASPCSGHGFKFASVLGEILADLALNGATRHDISRFTLKRLTLPPVAAPV